MQIESIKKLFVNHKYNEIIESFYKDRWEEKTYDFDLIVFFGKSLNILRKYEELNKLTDWIRSKYKDDEAIFYSKLFQAYAQANLGNLESCFDILTQFEQCEQNQLRFKAYLFLARAKSITGEITVAIEILENILAGDLEEVDKGDIADAYSRLGTIYGQSGRFTQAIDAFLQTLDILGVDFNIPTRLSTMINLGVIYVELGNFTKAEKQFREVKIVAENSNNYKINALASLNLGELYLDWGKMSEARKFLENAYQMANLSKIPNYQALVLAYMGELETTLGNYAKAEENLRKAKQIIDQLDRLATKLVVLRHICILKAKQGQSEEAILILRKIIDIKHNKNFIHEIGEEFLLIIELFLNQGNIEDAEHYLSSMEKLKDENDIYNLDQLYLLAFSEVHFYKNNFGLAFSTIEEFLRIATDKKLIGHQIQSYLLLTKIYLTAALWSTNSREDIDQALKTILKAREIALHSKNFSEFLEILNVQSTVELMKGNYTKSVEILREAKLIAEEKRLDHYTGWINNNIEDIESRAIFETNPHLSYQIQKQNLKLALESVSTALGREDPTITSADTLIENFLVYKLSKMGPVLVYNRFPISQGKALSSGAYLMTTLSKSSIIGKYHTGFYGPLPFIDKEALVLTTIVQDDESPDPRLKNTNYLMLVLVFDSYTQKINRSMIKSILESNLANIHNIAELTESFLETLSGKFISKGKNEDIQK